MDMKWEDGFKIRVSVDEDGACVIDANWAGLLSLSQNILALAKEQAGSHFHLDAYNSLEEGSCELIIGKTE